MSRGKWLKTKAKEAYHLAKKKWAGYFQAKHEYYRVHPEEWVKERLASMLSNIDPIETAAILGGTIVIHEIIFKTDAFKSAVSALETIGDPSKVTQFEFFKSIYRAIWGEDMFKKTFGESATEALTHSTSFTTELFLWLAAFSISYFAVKHGADLLPTAKNFFGVSA